MKSLSTALALSLISVPVLAQDNPNIDPLALEIAQASSDFLASQPALAVNWLITYDEVLDGRQKISHAWTGESELVRGVGYRSSSAQGTEIREYYYDGASFSAVFADAAEYATVPVTGDFSKMVQSLNNDFDFALPLADVFDQSNAAASYEQLTEARYIGEVFFGNQTAHHIAFRRFEGDWQMWISTNEDNPIPLMIVGTDPYSQGWPQFQATLYDWSFEATWEDTSFTFTAPDGFEETSLTPDEDGVEGQGQ